MENTFDEKAAMKLSKSKNTHAEVLKTLVGKSAKVDRLIAKHPNADATVLDGLSGSNDKMTIRHVLGSPNFEKLLITKPAVIFQMGRIGKNWIGRQLERLDIPQYLIDWSISQRASQWLPVRILQVLWENPLVPDEAFKAKNREESYMNVQISDLEHAIAKGKFMADLGLDVRVATPEDIKEFDRCGYVVSLDGGKTYAPYSHPDIGDELTKYWDNLVPPSGDAQTVQGQFGCIVYRFTNEYWRNGLMNWAHQIDDDDFWYRGLVEFLEDRLVAEKPFNPDATAYLADILKQLFYQYYPAEIDIFHASNFETIIEHLECAIYAYAKKFPELTPNDEAEKCKIAESQDIDQDALEKLASDVSSQVRSVVASNLLCSVETLRKLSADRSVQVRLAVAKHEKTPIDVIEKLSTDDNVNVRCAAARREDFPVTEQHDFISAQFALLFSQDGDDRKSTGGSAQSCDKRVLPFDVSNPQLGELLAQLGPEFFMEKLAALLEKHVDQRDGSEDDLWCCRRFLYLIYINKEAPLLSKRLIEKYPNILDFDDYKFVKVAESRKTTPEELASLIGINVKIDRRIAKNRNATDEILELLSNSSDDIVRKNVEKRRNIDLEKV